VITVSFGQIWGDGAYLNCYQLNIVTRLALV